MRKLENSFNLDGPHGKHDVFVMVPLGMSLRSLHEKQDTGVFGEILAVIAIDQVLLGLEFLHLADVIHTGESPGRTGTPWCCTGSSTLAF